MITPPPPGYALEAAFGVAGDVHVRSGVGRRGRARQGQGEGNTPTKHDLGVCGRRNADRLGKNIQL